MAQRRVDILLSARDEASKVINNLANGTLPALVKQFGGMVAGFASAGAAITFVTDSFREFAESEKVTRKLEGALRDAGLTVQLHTAHLDKMATALARVSLADDEAIKRAQTLLISLGGLAGNGLDRATEAALDLSAALGIDLQQAAEMIAKAANGTTTAFGKLGFKFREGASEGEKFNAVLTQIQGKFGTAAEVEVDTLAGSVTQLAKAWGDVKKAAGGALASMGLTETLTRVALFLRVVEKAGLGPAIAGVSGNRGASLEGELALAERLADEAEAKRRGLSVAQLQQQRDEEAANLQHRRESERFWREEEERAAKAAEAIAKRIAEVRDRVLFEMEFGAPMGFLNPKRPFDAFGGETFPGAFGQLSPDAFKPDASVVKALEEARGEMQLLLDSLTGAIGPATNVQIALKEISEIQETVIKNGGVWTEQWQQLAGQILLAAEHADSFAGKLETALADRLTQAAYQFGDALVDVAFEGEMSFSKFAKAVLKDIARIIMQLLIARAIASFFGPAAPAAGSFGVPIAGGGIAASTGGIVLGPGRIQRFAAGGVVRPMGTDTVPAMLTPGEMVLPAGLTQELLRRVSRAGRGGGNVNVTINAAALDRRWWQENSDGVLDAIEYAGARRN